MYFAHESEFELLTNNISIVRHTELGPTLMCGSGVQDSGWWTGTIVILDDSFETWGRCSVDKT
jgi:hypothetical protein